MKSKEWVLPCCLPAYIRGSSYKTPQGKAACEDGRGGSYKQHLQSQVSKVRDHEERRVWAEQHGSQDPSHLFLPQPHDSCWNRSFRKLIFQKIVSLDIKAATNRESPCFIGQQLLLLSSEPFYPCPTRGYNCKTAPGCPRANWFNAGVLNPQPAQPCHLACGAPHGLGNVAAGKQWQCYHPPSFQIPTLPLRGR